MLLNAVVIVLREVIEASLIISVFLAFSQMINRSSRWLLLGLSFGVIAAIAYALNISVISAWQDGVGQELLNTTIHITLYFVLLLFVVIAVNPRADKYKNVLMITMLLGVVLASTREGSEIILYIHGFSSIPDLFQAVLIGGSIGAGIGISVGVFFYYLLVNLSKENGTKLGYILIVLVSSSMISQSIQLLIQADWVVSQYPLWDTSNWISERSVTGQLLYALIGYEATPTPIQVAAYLFSIILMLSLSALSYYSSARD